VARLVVVSRNPALPFALNSAGHEVVTVDDDHDVRWGEYLDQSDVVVLDIDDPGICALLIDGVAASARHDIRVLLLASSNPGWGPIVDQHTDGVTVLPLPLTMPRLTMALDVLAQGPPLPKGVRHYPLATPPSDAGVGLSISAVVEDPNRHEAVVESPVRELLSLGVEPFPQVPAMSHSSAPPTSAPPEPDTTQLPEAAVSQDVDPQPVARPPVHTEQTAGVTKPSAVGWTPAINPVQSSTATTGPLSFSELPALAPVVEPLAPRAHSLVRSLTAAIDQLDTVGDTASVVLSEAIALVPADAGAVLVRDGAAWRVSAGHGLRPLEERRSLTPEHWLVRQVSESMHGVLLEGGEGRWSELYGAPLSARAFLLASPLLPIGAILLLARDEHAFGDEDLEALLTFSDEAGHLLSDATDVRRLARLLTPFCDPED
jgi:hypothetical protein